MGKITLLVVLSLVVAVPMVMGDIDLQSVLEKAQQAGISQETIEKAANSDEAKQAIQDGTAQQTLNDAKDAMSQGGSSWSDWVRSNIGLAKGSISPTPASAPEESGLVGDIELSPSPSEAPAESTEKAPASAPPQGSSPSPSPTTSPSPSLTPSSSPWLSPSPLAETQALAQETGEGPTSAPSLAPQAA